MLSFGADMVNLSNIDQRELLKKVISDEINWREALDIISSQKKSWSTKEWKEKRKAKLKSYCEKCGSTTPPLIIQHTWHPTPLTQLFYEARNEYIPQWILWKETHPINVDTLFMIPDADGCPKCGSTTIRFRKKAMTWICVSKPLGVTCGYEFETPIRVVSNDAIRKLQNSAFQKSRDEFYDEYGIGKKVIVKAIEQHLRYTSFVNTKTLCKRCAFVEDRTDLILCSICHKYYHSKKVDRCSHCAGIDASVDF